MFPQIFLMEAKIYEEKNVVFSFFRIKISSIEIILYRIFNKRKINIKIKSEFVFYDR